MVEGLELIIAQPGRDAILRPRASAQFASSGANKLYTLPYKHQQLKHMHQSFVSPTIQMINEAANNN
jgi:hypothetical protein